MDFQTTIINFSALNIVSGFLLLALYLTFEEVRPTKYWAIGGLLLGAGTIFVALRGVFPDFISIGVANSLIFFGLAFHCRGFHEHLNGGKFSKAPFIVSAITSFLFFMLLKPEFLSTRIILSSATLSFLYGCSGHALLRKLANQSFLISLVGITFFTAALTHIFRLGVYFTSNIRETDFLSTSQLANFLIFSIGSIATLIFTAGCIFLVSLSFQEKLRESLASIEKESEEKSKFLAMLSHEMKTPLAVLKSILGNKKLTSDLIQTANQSVDEMDSIVIASQLSEQLESGAVRPKMTPVDVRAIAEAQIKKQNATNRITLEIDGTDHLQADDVMLRIIIKNLIENALKYSDPKSKISFKLENQPNKKYWRLSTSNKCSQATNLQTDRLFQKYYRGARARSQSGSGLGLYIVNGFVELMGGKASVHTSHDTIYLELTFSRDDHQIR